MLLHVNHSKLHVHSLCLRGAGRRPIIRTSAAILELPSKYQSYSELAEEFSSLINEKGALVFQYYLIPLFLVPCTTMLNQKKRYVLWLGITIYFSLVQLCI